MTELEMLQSIQQKMEASGTATAAEIKEMKGLIEAQKKAETEVKAMVDDLNKALIAKDATLKDIQDEVKELKAKGGRPVFSVPTVTEKKAVQMEIARLIGENKAAIEASGPGKLISPIEMKAVGVITDSNFSGTNAPYRGYLDWMPGMEPTGQFRFRQLVRTIQTGFDNVSFPRANTPIGEGSFGKQATQTATKAQVDRDYTMIDVLCKPMAGYAIVSRASLRNIIFLQSWLPTSMMEQLEDSEDADFANTLVAAATGSTTTTQTDVPQKLISYLKNLIKAKYNPNGLAVDPDVWEDLLVYRPGTAGEAFSLPGVIGVTPTGQITMLGRPVYPVNWLTGRRILVGDWSKAAIVQSEGLTMRQSDSHAEIFTANEIAFLLERIEALATFRPDAFITTTV